MEARIDERVLKMARHFALGRVTARRGCYGEQFDPFNQTWKPRVAGVYVRNTDDPPNGFATQDEALAAARKYRESCRLFLAKFDGA